MESQPLNIGDRIEFKQWVKGEMLDAIVIKATEKTCAVRFSYDESIIYRRSWKSINEMIEEGWLIKK